MARRLAGVNIAINKETPKDAINKETPKDTINKEIPKDTINNNNNKSPPTPLGIYQSIYLFI
jgi:hypothetical protein